MPILARGFAAALVFATAYPFFYCILFAQVFPDRLDGVANAASLLTAAAAGVWIWTKTGRAETGLVSEALKWAAMAGAIGFCAGFFGPMLLAPGADQGPLLGLFITGPMGFIAGGSLRLLCALWQRQAASHRSRAQPKLRRTSSPY